MTPVNKPIFGPLRSDSQRIGTIDAAVTEPPSGKANRMIKLSAVAIATKITISASIRVEKIKVLFGIWVGVVCVVFICFPFASITWFRFIGSMPIGILSAGSIASSPNYLAQNCVGALFRRYETPGKLPFALRKN